MMKEGNRAIGNWFKFHFSLQGGDQSDVVLPMQVSEND